ncbi:hypothetical protein DXT89_18345 [Agrobacterium vitis]|uniref:Uncharacterized protein n=1 Tax=Agrobacterium vitis TaxID=373 RepID=A0A109CME5_AGRVI|nr:hypothetical protein DXM22_16555 [Agrobacterium vitis]KAA3525292.1 hypothetical protein DXT89_18345 [Agrobacterium vitis]RCU50181.1 hypothetical protein ASB66_022590 [Agrobacterium vitis]
MNTGFAAACLLSMGNSATAKQGAVPIATFQFPAASLLKVHLHSRQGGTHDRYPLDAPPRCTKSTTALSILDFSLMYLNGSA